MISTLPLRRRCLLPLAAVLAAVTAVPARAQQRDTVPVRRDSVRAADSVVVPGRLARIGDPVRPPLSARRAFFYSLLVPGLGQTRLDRPNAGALFAGIEVGAIVMARKAAGDLRYARAVARTSPVTGYAVGPNGLPLRDSTGALVPLGREANRYTPRLRARRTQFEDWMAVLAFNHLIAGAEAFVTAHLWDMPARPSLRPAPGGGVALGASIDFGAGRDR